MMCVSLIRSRYSLLFLFAIALTQAARAEERISIDKLSGLVGQWNTSANFGSMKDIGTSSWHWKFGPDKKSLVGEHKIDQTRPIPLSIRIVTTLFIADGKLMKMEWVSGAMDGKSHSRLVEVEVAVQEDGMTTLTYPAAEWENRFFSDFHIDFGDGKFSKSGWKGDRKIFETVDVKRTASPEE